MPPHSSSVNGIFNLVQTSPFINASAGAIAAAI